MSSNYQVYPHPQVFTNEALLNACMGAGANGSAEPLSFGISISAPISSVPGSSTMFFLQPLFTGKVWASAGILIAAQLVLFLLQRCFGLEPLRTETAGPGQTVQMTRQELGEFLGTVSNNSLPLGPDIESGTLEPPEAPLIVYLAVWGDFTPNPFAPSVFILLPVFSFPGVRGALPMLILELLATIFVRAVVPPETTGARPLRSSDPGTQRILQFTPESLLDLLQKFNKHF